MRSLEFGNTNLNVSRIGLGTAALGRPGYINLSHNRDLSGGGTDKEAMKVRSHEMFDLAYKSGIRYFDTARSYGEGEAFLAEWIHSRGYEDVVIGSKWGYVYTADWQIVADKHEVKDHSFANLDRQFEESRTLLRSRLNIYQIHSATLDTGVLHNVAVLDRLNKLKAEGIRIGLTLSGKNQAEVLRKALNVTKDGHLLFDSVQATFNVLEQSAGEALQEAHKAGLGVIIKEGVANGRLTDQNDDKEDAAALNILCSIASTYDVGPDAIALAYIMHYPWADVVLSGAAIETHLLSNIQADKIRLKDEEVVALASAAMDTEKYWAKRGNLEWN